MTSELDDDILLDLFHFTALRAWMEQVAVTRRTPEMEPTRRRAYELYEQLLAERREEQRREASTKKLLTASTDCDSFAA